jgi:hypothetical protein
MSQNCSRSAGYEPKKRTRVHFSDFGSSLAVAMSTIGAASFGLASSIVGSSRPEAATNHLHGAAAEQKARADQKSLVASTLDDVADPEFAGDRDADGRMLYRRSRAPADAAEGEVADGGEGSESRPSDAFGDRGKSLDLEA